MAGLGLLGASSVQRLAKHPAKTGFPSGSLPTCPQACITSPSSGQSTHSSIVHTSSSHLAPLHPATSSHPAPHHPATSLHLATLHPATSSHPAPLHPATGWHPVPQHTTTGVHLDPHQTGGSFSSVPNYAIFRILRTHMVSRVVSWLVLE